MADKKAENDEMKTEKKTHHSSEHKKKSNVIYYIAGIIVILIIIFAYIKYFPGVNPQEEQVVASVNGEDITLSELNKVYDSMPPQLKLTTTKEDLLDKMIEENLVYQEAKKAGIVVDEEGARYYLIYFKQANGLTEERFNQVLAEQNMTEQELIKTFMKQLSVQKFLNETFISKIEVTDQEIRDYYAENVLSFKAPEQVTVRHILISDENKTDEENNDTAHDLLKEINKDNFCEYVNEHSIDTASLPNCGEYSFGKDDPFVQEFKDFAFSQQVGKIGIVKSQYGYHIIYIVKKTPARTIPLPEVEAQIKQFLVNEKAQVQYKTFYEELLSRNVVNIYYTEENQPIQNS